MFINNYELDVDIKKALSRTLPFYVNEDNASIGFHVFDNGSPIDLSIFNRIVIRHILKTKEVVECVGIVGSNGESVSYILDKRIVKERGMVDVILSMYTSTSRVSAQPFNIEIL